MGTRILRCGNKQLILGERTLIMGILNVTPDSFSDGGRYDSLETAVARAKELAAEGADILDIGGESTRPGSEPVTAAEELRRVIPVIERISKEVDIPISIDTYKAEVAAKALQAGAHILNDVWGLKRDPDMAKLAAESGHPIILMHNRATEHYRDLVNNVAEELLESVDIARKAGVSEEQIILDPGIGFAKTQEQNLFLLKHMDQITKLSYPVLLGTSRKRVIRNVLGLPSDDVVEGTGATVALGIAQGVQIVRVHDVREMKRVALMADAVVRAAL